MIFCRRRFFYSILDVIDGLVIIVSFVVDMVYVALGNSFSNFDYVRYIPNFLKRPLIFKKKMGKTNKVTKALH